jgi:hypothetical protein
MLHHLQRGGLGFTRRQVAASGDPYFANVIFLAHMDGSNGSTTFTEVTGRTISAAGNAQLSTTDQKFGTACGLFDGSGDYISTPHTSDLLLATGDFTIEFWIRFTSVSAAVIIGHKAESSSDFYPWQTFKNGSNQIRFRGFDTGPSTLVFDLTSVNTVSANIWYHIAFTRAGNTFRMFLDGNEEASSSYSGALFSNATAMVWGAYTNPAAAMDGRLDDLRITAGVARYTGNFTPPTQAFPDS